MKPFQAPLDDILFTLTHVAGANELPEFEAELTQEIAGHFASFAEAEIAPLDEPGDQQGCRLEAGRVVMPDGFAELYHSYAEQGWQGLTAPEEFGGQGLDSTLLSVTSEIFTGANHSLQMITGLVPGAIRTIVHFGSEAQKAAHIPPLASGETLATMCLTESGAGSDLSCIRCRAARDGDGWRIDGEKIFISGGDQNMSARILHLVLARTSDDGIKGLSLFVCPCTRADGSRNAVSVTRIEEKMGLHASPTCQLAFDGAEAELIGQEGQGLAAMFTMMNHARADVALQGVAHAARATDIARSYAAERVQGRGSDGAPATLDAHADVQRILGRMDALALGGRALAHLAAVALERGDQPDLVEALTPIAKVYCTEAGMEAAELGIQILGGYGYLQEYRVEQTYRDARITAIYEGANGIHERALVTRLLPGRWGDALEAFLVAEAGVSGDESCTASVALWKQMRKDLRDRPDPTPAAHDFTGLSAEVLLQCLWQRMLRAADAHPDPERIRRVAATAVAAGRARADYHAAMVRLAG
ncbi:acyl-CoA dehydrogenase family protein [Aliiruegeria sabulilitoris]|uniref:acyl-CoA dehydrogenase family protein n=1 Tax=Aliiruegeria sabulilitoris TaxID=1510458 RepID=UPI0008315613|nr:acyl-CoA dehydrogenase family protein [Aliiruegeria sabulilitoris]NDR56211.1 acyl-CoA dehydrogenase [Pseudoruegeria sp. M32A2M]